MFGSWVNIVSLVQLGPEEVYSAMPVVYSKSTIMIPVRYAATKRYALCAPSVRPQSGSGVLRRGGFERNRDISTMTTQQSRDV
jgi:hypothetical protein